MLIITTRRRIQQFRQIREALQELADAVALTVIGEAWSDEVDEAMLNATELIGPMGDSEALVAAAERREQREYEAWSDGYHLGENDVAEVLADKDAFISRQAALIQVLIDADLIKWDQVTVELRDKLADYV